MRAGGGGQERGEASSVATHLAASVRWGEPHPHGRRADDGGGGQGIGNAPPKGRVTGLHPGVLGVTFLVTARGFAMAIVRIKHKGLRELFEDGHSSKVAQKLQANAILIMDHLDGISSLDDCQGVKTFHELKGDRKGEYSMHVSGNWCITFTFDGADVAILDLEDYH